MSFRHCKSWVYGLVFSLSYLAVCRKTGYIYLCFTCSCGPASLPANWVFIDMDYQKLFLESEVEQTNNIWVCFCAAFVGSLLTVPADCRVFSFSHVLKCFQFYGWEKLELEKKKRHICSKEKWFHLYSQEFVSSRWLPHSTLDRYSATPMWSPSHINTRKWWQSFWTTWPLISGTAPSSCGGFLLKDKRCIDNFIINTELKPLHAVICFKIYIYIFNFLFLFMTKLRGFLDYIWCKLV